jgi:hypothetical protein
MKGSFLAVGTLLLAAVAGGAGCAARIIVPGPPPVARVEVRPLAPSRHHVWIAGHWTWRGGWAWVAGRWEVPPRRGAAWVSGRWVRASRGWRWVPGYWRR